MKILDVLYREDGTPSFVYHRAEIDALLCNQKYAHRKVTCVKTSQESLIETELRRLWMYK